MYGWAYRVRQNAFQHEIPGGGVVPRVHLRGPIRVEVNC